MVCGKIGAIGIPVVFQDLIFAEYKQRLNHTRAPGRYGHMMTPFLMMSNFDAAERMRI
jgi:gluconate kinase